MSETAAVSALVQFLASVRPSAAPEQSGEAARASFAVDGLIPAVIVAPENAAQVHVILREAQKARLAVIAAGGRQHLGAGNQPSAYDVALSLRRMDAIVAHEPADMTVTVEPGVRLTDLNARLAEHGQMLPLDPPCGADATVGGVLAANPSGPLRYAFGTARDWLIGARLAHADGGASKSGGRVVKNVTGYDMHKLYVGSLGTLGVITEATFKLAPTPRMERTLAASFKSARDACAAVLSAYDAGMTLHVAEVLSPAAAGAICGEARWTAVVRVAGGEAAVARTLRDLPRHAGRATFEERDDGLWTAWAQAFRPAHVSLHAALLSSAVVPALDALEELLAGSARVLLSATVAAGVVRAQLEAASVEATAIGRARDIVAQHGGTLAIEAAPPAFKREIDVFGPSRPDFAIMRRLKEQFDPLGTLSPGRFAGRL